MATIISLIVIVLCLAVILAIVAKKFPALAILDVGSMPAEKEAKFKEQIIKARVERDFSRISGWLGRAWLSLSRQLFRFSQKLTAQLKQVRLKYRVESRLPWPEKQKRLAELFLRAEDLMKAEDYPGAEEKLIEAVSLDQKNLRAFFLLGEIYERQKKLPEARQTYGYALGLSKQQAKDGEDIGPMSPQEIYFALASLELDAGQAEAAWESVSDALDREPNNPRYLDLILRLSIIRGDKEQALGYWQRLFQANPENNKLAEIREEIENLGGEAPQ